jgi:hypothetical protein
MTFFASTYEWPTGCMEFEVIGEGAYDGSGEIVVHNDRFILKAPGCFMYATGQPKARTLKTTIDGRPALLRGDVFAIDGELGLRLYELRIGSDDDEPTYVEMSAVFEYLSSVCSYRPEDGAQRSAADPIDLPALIHAAPMSAVIPSSTNTVRLIAASATVLDEFEPHLEALQDLLTFALDMPVGRLSLSATDTAGRVVEIHGRERFAPFGRPPRRPVEHLLRLSGTYAQAVMDRWWDARETLRPIPQLLAGLRYQPGYVEADVILSAAAIEAFATRTDVGEDPRLSNDEAQPILNALDGLVELNENQKTIVSQMKHEVTRTTLHSKMELLLARVSPVAIANSRVSTADWLPKFKRTRNHIAHGNGGSVSDVWTDKETLRAVRDANRLLLSLAFLTHLGVPEAALERAAERLGNRYSGQHRSTGIFQ